jgi:hypothetical protein
LPHGVRDGVADVDGLADGLSETCARAARGASASSADASARRGSAPLLRAMPTAAREK